MFVRGLLRLVWQKNFFKGVEYKEARFICQVIRVRGRYFLYMLRLIVFDILFVVRKVEFVFGLWSLFFGLV